jgi:flagellar hook-associated protein 3 FlgL
MSLRVGTFAQHRLVTSFALGTQRRLFDAQVQVGSGKTAQRYQGIARDASRLVDLKNAREQALQFRHNITVVRTRLDLMSFGLDEIEETVSAFKSQVVSAVNGNAAQLVDLTNQAQGLMAAVGDILNSRDGTRYLFAGVRTDTVPVNVNNVVDPPHAPPFGAGSYPSAEDTTRAYYSGGGTASDVTVKLDFNLSVSYGVTADELAFEQILRGLQLVTSSQLTPTVENDRLREGASVLEQGLASLEPIINRVAVSQVRLERFDEKHRLFVKSQEDLAGQIENVDPAEAITRLNAEQVALEAAFNTLARLQNSTLNNFLR